MKELLLKYRIAAGVIVLVLVVGGAWWYVRSSAAPAFASVTVGKGDIVEAVDEPADVMSEQNAGVAFQEGGQIAAVYVHEGSVVHAGEALAALDASQLSAAAAQAEAAVSAARAAAAAAQAKLDGAVSGTRPEQLQIDENAVASAKSTLAVSIGNAYSAADDAIENQTDNLFSNPKTTNPAFLVPTASSQTENDLASQRVAIGAALAKWYGDLSAPGADASSLAPEANAALAGIDSFINEISLAVNGAPAAAALSPSQLSADKAYVATARTEAEAAIGTDTSGESSLKSAEDALALAEAGATPQDIAAQQAALDQANAAVAQAEAAATGAQVALSHATLVAPFSGTVQALTAQVGQVVAAGAPVLTLVNQSGLKIEACVPETEIAGIKPGEGAQITLDAFGTGTSFPATVTTVDPGETTVNGAPAYLVTLHFAGTASGVKDGMTGNVRIIEAEHDGVIEVPAKFIIANGSSSFVLVPGNGGTEEREVAVGIEGDNGMTEVSSGLSVGDKVVSF